MQMKRIAVGALAAAAMLAPVTAAAQNFEPKTAGDIMVRGRAIGILPDEGASISPGGGDIDIEDKVVPELDVTYFVTDHIAAELIAATARHDVSVDGNAALGDASLGDVRLLPPTLTAQYHFRPSERISPYVGAGVNYTAFFDESPGALDSVDYDNSFGAALQAGVDVAISGGWFVNADVKKLFLDTDVSGSVGGTAVDAGEVDVDPWIVGVGLGYRF
ncbi:outer membrane protein [Limimonas halophila]|uniref:Outer membrane protein n=2 Tax=Limimonas halophila TaxID=1082479 RepID=A0A1G7QVL4_9PROT|nr:outer membrane protein [Limimonas halophila]